MPPQAGEFMAVPLENLYLSYTSASSEYNTPVGKIIKFTFLQRMLPDITPILPLGVQE